MLSDTMRAVAVGLSAAAIYVTTPPAGVAPPPIPPAGNAERGKAVYERYCSQCHGDKGDGKGEVAPFITPKPRDFRQGLFKFRSTPLGALPTVDDLEHTISNGLYGTAMPPFAALNPRAKLDVIAYIQTFSKRWQTETTQPAPLVVPAEPAPTRESVARGQKVFVSACATCHGDGTGDGPLAKSLVDAWGNPVPPADLTRGHAKSGEDGRDIYLRVMTGLNGTPMPGFAGSLTPEQTWDVVHYVESLGPWHQSTVALRSPGMDSMAAVTQPAPASGNATTIRMVGDANGYRFEPSRIMIHAGDAVTFVNQIGGPHNITFWPDSVPSAAKAQLQSNMPNTTGPLTGPLLINAGDQTTISFAKVPPGTYAFYCMPHLALGMKGQVVVQ